MDNDSGYKSPWQWKLEQSRAPRRPLNQRFSWQNTPANEPTVFFPSVFDALPAQSTTLRIGGGYEQYIPGTELQPVGQVGGVFDRRQSSPTIPTGAIAPISDYAQGVPTQNPTHSIFDFQAFGTIPPSVPQPEATPLGTDPVATPVAPVSPTLSNTPAVTAAPVTPIPPAVPPVKVNSRTGVGAYDYVDAQYLQQNQPRGFFDNSYVDPHTGAVINQQGWGMPAIEGAQSIWNAYLGFQNLGIQEDQLQLARKAYNTNLYNQVQTLENNVRDRFMQRNQGNTQLTQAQKDAGAQAAVDQLGLRGG